MVQIVFTFYVVMKIEVEIGNVIVIANVNVAAIELYYCLY